jgi:hypothetical protein
MPALATMTWDELLAYKLKLHHDHRDYNIIVARTKDALVSDRYNRMSERVEGALRRVYDELTRRENEARRLNRKPY